MWKALNHGDKVSPGDTLRYRSRSDNSTLAGDVYVVVRIDQHHFELKNKDVAPDAPELARIKAVRYLDVGYNVLPERWFGPEISATISK
ncbi:MAG TPA: hypothetical protein VL727_18480 [Puia sp.]|nr:hypothetical protein [Puia sp.]